MAEYAHRFAGAYDLAWWVNSEQGGLIGDQFAALAPNWRAWRPGEYGRGRACADHSLEQGWAEIAASVQVDVLARAQSVALLQSRVAGFMAETGCPA